jgi:hypothetical protein
MTCSHLISDVSVDITYILFALGVILLIRELGSWFFKTNKVVEMMNANTSLLKEIKAEIKALTA